jgi:hypothetical protein
MKITYAITVCNEFIEIQTLFKHLLERKQIQDNIVVLYDEQNGDPEIETFLRTHSINGEFAWHKAKFDKDFAKWKNHLNSLCSGDYIVNIDADELPTADFMEHIHDIIDLNPVDVIRVPRSNKVSGLTEAHIKQWGWNVNEYDEVNWPDVQSRVYFNVSDRIKWVGKVHERIDGYITIADLPSDSDTTLFFHHRKTITKQEKQNQLYNTL